MRTRSCLWLLTGLLPLAVIGTSCRAPDGARVAVRLFPPTSESLPLQVPFYEEVEVARYAFDSPEETAKWTPERVDGTYEQSKDGLLITTSSPDPSVFRAVDIDAAAVEAIRVTSSGLTTDAYMQLYWAHAGELFSEERTLGVARDDGTGALVPSYTFRVKDHPRWTGRITMLRLDPTSVADRPIQLRSVTAVHYVVRDELLARLKEHAYRVDLEGDARYAVLLPPRIPFERKVKVPRHANLRLALGLEPGVVHPVRFLLTADADGELSTLLDETVQPCQSGRPCRWRERAVPLDALGGRWARLRFETESKLPLDLRRGFPAVADLELETPGARRPRPNVVLIVLDTLRADRVSLYGYTRETTPRIDAWARRRAVTFSNVIAQAPWTLPSHVTMFSGLDPLTHGTNQDEPASESLVTLAERLRDAGYATRAVTGGGFLATEYALMQGFDRVSYHYEPRVHPETTGDDIASGTEHALAWLETMTERPFFLLFHTYETHSPYRPREPYFSRFHGAAPPQMSEPLSTMLLTPQKAQGYLLKSWVQVPGPGSPPSYRPLEQAELPLLNDIYDSEVANADEHAGRILERLRKLGLEDDTIVILTSDHGESLGEHGLAGHQSVQECELRVPLVVARPSGRGAGARIATQVRLEDLAPTILDLVGLAPLANVEGRSLARLLDGSRRRFPEDAWSYAASSNFGLGLRLGNRLKYTYNNSVWPALRGQEGLYALDSGAGEQTNLAAADPRTAELRGRTRDRYRDDTSGLRVTYSNHSQLPLHGRLRGKIVAPLQVKALDDAAVNVDWYLQTLRFTVPPGRVATFFVEGTVFGEILVGASLSAKPPATGWMQRVVNLATMSGPWQVILANDGTWRGDADADIGAATGVRIWVDGGRAERAQPDAIDAQLREQLRRLGYVQ